MINFPRIIFTFLMTIISIKAMDSEPVTPHTVTPVASEIFGLFKGLHTPFNHDGFFSSHPQFSPLHGVDNQIVKNLRLHGHFESKKTNFPRPNWDGRDSKKYPQDWTASLLEFLFPSHIGFLVDNTRYNPIHKWLAPKNIALIFNAISAPGFYENPVDGTIKLALALQPDTPVKKLESDYKAGEVTRLRLKDNGPKYGPFSKLKSLMAPPKEIPFAELLFMAFKETEGDKATQLGYPQHTVERILLTYMWEKKKTKADLKPFYQSLMDDIIDKTAASKIIWTGGESGYTNSDYSFIAAQYNKNNPSLNLELSTLLKLGYPYFEDKFPPLIDYGVTTVKIDGNDVSYSDCGESSLFNFFMMVLYDFETKIFDWTVLEKLKESRLTVKQSLIDFFRYTCPSPFYSNSQKTRNAWGEVLFDLNADSDHGLVEYMGEKHSPKGKKCSYKCCILPGVDNMLNVIDKLIGGSVNVWIQTQLDLTLADRLSFLCSRFNDKNSSSWKWKLQSNDPMDPYPDKAINDPKNVILIFENNWKPIFEWHFEENHFDFNRVEDSKTLPSQASSFTSLELNQSITEQEFPTYFYKDNLEGIAGKSIAYHKILQFKKKYKKKTFDTYITRWIDQKGEYFAEWKDFHTNNKLLNFMLLEGLTIDDIFNLKIPELTAHLFWIELEAQRIEGIKYIFKKDRELFISEGASSPRDKILYKIKNRNLECPSSGDDFAALTRVLSVALKKIQEKHLNILLAAGFKDYVSNVFGVSANQLLSFFRLELIEQARNDIEAPVHLINKDLHKLNGWVEKYSPINEQVNAGINSWGGILEQLSAGFQLLGEGLQEDNDMNPEEFLGVQKQLNIIQNQLQEYTAQTHLLQKEVHEKTKKDQFKLQEMSRKTTSQYEKLEDVTRQNLSKLNKLNETQ